MTATKVEGIYEDKSFSGLRGSVSVKLNQDQTDPSVKLSFVNVDEHISAWVPEKWAVLGFSPKSNFLQYLRQNSKD